MRDLDGLIDTVSVWIDFNIDSSAMALLIVAVIIVVSGAICLLLLHISRHNDGIELARYGAKLRPLNSFVCKVCLHRSYAESHIRQRYCSRCDKFFAAGPKVWKFHEIEAVECPAPEKRVIYRDFGRSTGAGRRKTRA